MSATEPLLKNAPDTLQPGSEAKLFSATNQLLQHMKRKYNVLLPTRHNRKRYIPMNKTSAGLYVSKGQHTQQPGKDDSANDTHFTMLDSATTKSKPLKATTYPLMGNDKSSFLENPTISSTHEPTSQCNNCKRKHYSQSSHGVKIHRANHMASLSTTWKHHENICPHLVQTGVSNTRNFCCHGYLVSETEVGKFATEDNVQICPLGNKCVPVISDSSVSATQTSEETQQNDGNKTSRTKVELDKAFDNHPQPRPTLFEGMGHKNVTRPVTDRNARKKWPSCDMARLQSHRTQCCCCAVGVFAAMFGIFMLSAGICIVLNVTFMEVDTSGLPPNLHNDNGKKIVGIILICVAIAFLGLSATVSIMYFTLCNRKNQATTKATSSDHSKQQKTNTMGAASRLDRPKSRDGPLPEQKRTVSSNTDGVQFSRSASHLRSDYIKAKAYRGRKNGKSCSVLPPHQEEDPESTMAAMELSMANEICPSRRHSQGRVLGYKDMGGENTVSSSVIVPIILVQNGAGHNFTETQLNDTCFIIDEDSVSQTCSEIYEDIGSTKHTPLNDTLNLGFTNKSYLRSQEVINFKQKLTDNLDLQPTSDLTMDMSSQPELQHQFLVVRPAEVAGLDSSSSSICSTADKMIVEKTDHFSDLSSSFNHRTAQMTTGLNLNDDENRTKSRSIHNSVFSLDGDNPDLREDSFQKRREKALEPNISV